MLSKSSISDIFIQQPGYPDTSLAVSFNDTFDTFAGLVASNGDKTGTRIETGLISENSFHYWSLMSRFFYTM